MKKVKNIEYTHWTTYPKIIDISDLVLLADTTVRKMDTKHEGKIIYEKYWNFWVRAGEEGDSRSDIFFRDYKKSDNNTNKLFSDIGVSSSYPKSETEIWDRIAKLWSWLATHVQYNATEYGKVSSQPNSWPSILDYAKYYNTYGKLVWVACFSKAHLFASLLGHIIPIRRRMLLAEAHHTEADAPPTATHVYVAVYVSDRWFYLDPTTLLSTPFPSFKSRRSIGVENFLSVDYEHPYKTIILPGSGFKYVPYLST